MNDQQVDEARALLAAWPDTRAVELLLPDLNGILRGKRIGRRELLSLWRDGIAFPATGILLDSRGALIDGLSYGSDDGDPDYVCRPVPGSLVPVPWAKTASRPVPGDAGASRWPAIFRRCQACAGRRAGPLR